MALKIIAALSENHVIGNGGNIPWKLSDDMSWFRRQTGIDPVVMGRKTYESLPERFRPLPRRENIILTRRPKRFEMIAVTALDDFQKVLGRARRETLWAMGGAEIYKLALPHASEMYLTRVEITIVGDAFFPMWNDKEWSLVSIEHRMRDEQNEHNFTWEVWRRK
jgi:dihydrofolate reductase